jgi:signal transduction histidine kinase
MFSIKFKLLISFTLVFGLLIIGYSVFIYHRVRSSALEQLDTRIELFADRFTAELNEGIHNPRKPTAQEIVEARKETREPFLLQLNDTTGSVVFADSLFSLSNGPLHGSADTADAGVEVRSIGSNAYRIIRISLTNENQVRGSLVIAASMAEIEMNLNKLRWAFFITIPLAFLIAGVAAYGITLIAFRPITTMIESAERITERNLDQQLPIKNNHDEVGRLGATFNSMIKRIGDAFQSQKQFIADASHEFRTPLTIISSELEYARRDLSGRKADESIRIALDEVDHLKKLTGDLLLIAKLDARQVRMNKTMFRFDELVVECVRKVTQTASTKGITFRLHIERETEMMGDEEKMESVIINLLDNAVKYCRKKSVIDVDLNARNGSEARLSVTNSGSGIPAGQETLIFDRFYRVNPSRSEQSGSGLGLSIARQIVEMHHGTISVISTPRKKTTFTITIPLLSD